MYRYSRNFPLGEKVGGEKENKMVMREEKRREEKRREEKRREEKRRRR
jgi:hypothetical protein